MAIKIEGTAIRKSGGGGLGSLLGKIAGIGAGIATGGLALPAIATGMSVGGAAGGLVGGAIKKGEEKDLAVPIAGQRESGLSGQQAPKPSPIDRMNSLMDIGATIGGGVDAYNNMPVRSGGGGAMDRRLGGPNYRRLS